MALLVSNVPWSAGTDPVPELASVLGIPRRDILEHHLVRKSLDARHRRQRWLAVFKVEVRDESGPLRRPGVRRWTARDAGRYGLDDGAPVVSLGRTARPIVVGAGPAGLFAALYLAEAGAPGVLLDRGGPVEDRVPRVNGFWRRKEPLSPEDNVLFGEGGAGTFSDGKIYTRRREGEIGYIFRRLIDFGADPDILHQAWAHLGTDKVRAILPVFRARLEELGVEVRYHQRVDRVLVEDGIARGVQLGDGSRIDGSLVLVAPGHSARDTLRMLIEVGAEADARPIAIGARIEHPQALIDQARYGGERGALPAASYRLAFNPDTGRSAHTFCMCPGGMVVPAMEQDGLMVVNGMSFSAQRSFWANSAVIVRVDPEDYGRDAPDAGLAWQEAIERRCFAAGGGDFTAPAQRVEDLLAGRGSTELPRVSYPLGARSTDLRDILPPWVCEGMARAIRAFDAQLPGFAGPEGVLIAPETRTTSPVRFRRTEGGESVSVKGLFPMGEGAGYGGGIVSCALDGLRVARSLVDTLAR